MVYIEFYFLETLSSQERRIKNTRYFNQRQLQQTTNQGRVIFTLGRQQEVKPATFSRSQKSTPFRGQQNNEPSKNAVPTDRGHEHHFHKHHATVISCRRGNNRIRKILSSKLLIKQDRRGTVVNLTRKVFSKDVFELFNKNLNFCPVPGEFNRLNSTADLQRFFR